MCELDLFIREDDLLYKEAMQETADIANGEMRKRHWEGVDDSVPIRQEDEHQIRVTGGVKTKEYLGDEYGGLTLKV